MIIAHDPPSRPHAELAGLPQSHAPRSRAHPSHSALFPRTPPTPPPCPRRRPLRWQPCPRPHHPRRRPGLAAVVLVQIQSVEISESVLRFCSFDATGNGTGSISVSLLFYMELLISLTLRMRYFLSVSSIRVCVSH